MALSIFEDKSRPPTEDDLAEALGECKPFWDELYAASNQDFGPLKSEWKFYGKNSGWTLLLKNNKRTILYLYPQHGAFITLFVFGEKAVDAARQAMLPAGIMTLIDDAKPYMEGRSFQVKVGTSDDLAVIHKLAAIKMAH